MKPKQFIQSIKRFTAALALSCLLLVGATGVQPVSPQDQEAVAFVLPVDQTARVNGPGLYVPNGNFWSG